MCDLVNLADKYGIAGLVILALFSLLWFRDKADEKIASQLNEDIKANTKATIELTARMSTICQNRRFDDLQK